MEAKEMLRELLSGGRTSGNEGGGNPQNPERLKQALAVFNEKHVFKPGDIVEWKPGMKFKKGDGPFIVVDVLPEPIFADKNSGSPYFNEPLDIICAHVDSDDDFLAYHYDSRRFQPHSVTNQ